MGARPHIGTAARRVRLAHRHLLAPSARAASPACVARGMVALHATDPATVYLSAAARLRQPTVDSIQAALYEERTLVRMLGMRRTMFVVPREIASVVHHACGLAIAAQQRKLTVQLFTEAGLAADVPTWLAGLEHATLAALAARGEATAQELGADVPELKRQVVVGAGKPYSAVQGIASRILLMLAAEGRIVRGRPRGSWISSQYRWAPLAAWIGSELPERPVPDAQADLIGRWLRTFGPAPVSDIKWWTGLTMAEVKRALQALAAVEVDLDDGPGVALPEDLEPEPAVEPWVNLLPALDPTPMGYAARGWFLGEYAPALFDRSGNIGPTVWSNGRIVGGWAQRADGVIAWRLLEDVGGEVTREVAAAAERLGVWIGSVRVTPRFRTPLERELAA